MPPTKATVDKLVSELDIDKSGKISREEFGSLATVVAQHVAGRVAVVPSGPPSLDCTRKRTTEALCRIVHEDVGH